MEKKDRDMLIELNTNFKSFKEDWDDIKEGGFRFCGVRHEEIKDVRSTVIWVRNTLIGLIFIIMTGTIGYFMEGRHAKADTGIDARGYILNSQPDGTR